MPDERRHRGPHPEDKRWFAPDVWPRLRSAVGDYSWLLEREYAAKSALELVGNRYQLAERQRLAVMRCAAAESSITRRRASEVAAEDVAGQHVLLDGYNVLTTIEAALSGGVILQGRDGCYRDIASMHGTFRKVEETLPAISLIGQTLQRLGVSGATWYLDSPVSNSGRLRGLLLEVAHEHGWKWDVELVLNPDPVLAKATDIIVTADSVILDACEQWFNLVPQVLRQHALNLSVIEL